MKKIVAVLLCMVLTFAAVPSFAAVRSDDAAFATQADDMAIAAAIAEVEQCMSELETCKAALETAKADLEAAKLEANEAGKVFLNNKSGENFTVEILIEQLRKDASLQQYMNNEDFEAGVASALSVSNLNAAADFVDECNTLRAKHSLAPLKINYRLMILSAVSAAISSQVIAHVAVPAIYNGALGSLGSYVTQYPGENLAWRYSDPFDGWYDAEKKIYDEAVASGKYPGLDTMDAYEVSQSYHELSTQVGHYLNIVDPRNVETGFAHISENSTDEQSFSWDQSASYGEVVTPAEFKTALAQAAQATQTKLSEMKTKYDKAEANVSKAQYSLDRAQERLDELTKEPSDPDNPDEPKPDETTDPSKPDDPKPYDPKPDEPKPDDPVDPSPSEPPTSDDPTDEEVSPKATSIKKLSPSKKAFTVTWKKQTTGTTGYQIQCSLKKNFKSGVKKIKVKKNTQTKKKVTGLKRGKKYYVRIRTYKETADGTVYSSWSKVKSVKTK
ncbi:MAG: fibronectin type III domain-containing protein [Eubacterium sp.]|nr:fibronectin type III domain-containing protein [Eubacterium sp.]